MLSQDRLKQVFKYCPETGLFTRILSTASNVNVGDISRCLDKKGYVVIRIDGRLYKAHRLAWLYMTGSWPTGELDHKNTIRNDNRFTNLRECSRQQNLRNTNISKKSTTGFKGVSLSKNKKSFRAYATVMGKQINLGTYPDIVSANNARSEFAKTNFKEFYRE